MGCFDDFLHHVRCSLHPQLRHYSPDSLRDPVVFRQHLDYWNLPESFRKHCSASFDATGAVGCYSWDSRCVFSFDSLTPPSPHAVLLRNIYVPKEHRGQHCCTEALSQIVRVAESSATCIVAVVRPFEIGESDDSIEAVIDSLHRSPSGIWYVANDAAKQAMNTRLKKAGFRNYDLSSTMSEQGAKTIPISHHWIFVPKTADQLYVKEISNHLVNEDGNEYGAKEKATYCGESC